jgi:heme/copper-type cytochrome/quinol oxidase subunit 3
MAAPQLALPSGERRADPSLTVYGIVVLGVATVMVMGGLFGAWLIIKQGTSPWPPKGFVVQNYYGTTLSVTALMSGLVGWWGLYGVLKGERRQAIVGFSLAILLQAAQINLITYVLRSSHLSPRKNPYSAMYFAVHLAVAAVIACGIAVSVVALVRVVGGQITKSEPAVAWSAAWYGTVVTVTWLVTYTIVYVVG